MGERRCTAKTKAGKPCRSTSVRDNGLCFAHQPEEVRESHGFGGPQPGAGRPRSPRVVDVLRERIEADIDRWLQPLEDALTADRGVVVGDGPHARVEFVPDHGKRLKAQEQAFDRAFGRPTQPVMRDESQTVDEQIRRYLAEMDRRDPARGDVTHANGSAPAPS